MTPKGVKTQIQSVDGLIDTFIGSRTSALGIDEPSATPPASPTSSPSAPPTTANPS